MNKKQRLSLIGPILGFAVFIILLLFAAFVMYDAPHQQEHLILGVTGLLKRVSAITQTAWAPLESFVLQRREIMDRFLESDQP